MIDSEKNNRSLLLIFNLALYELLYRDEFLLLNPKPTRGIYNSHLIAPLRTIPTFLNSDKPFIEQKGPGGQIF